jgi:hypothetical protein
MKTKIIHISLLATFAFLSLNVSAYSARIIKNKKTGTLITAAKELKESGNNFISQIKYLKEFNKKTMVFPEDEIQIEDWMTSGLTGTLENKNILKQDPTLEDWMVHSLEFSKEVKALDVEPEIQSWMYETK